MSRSGFMTVGGDSSTVEGEWQVAGERFRSPEVEIQPGKGYKFFCNLLVHSA